MGLTQGRRGVGNRGRGRQEGASSTFILRKYIRQGTKKAPKPHQQFHWEECLSETSWVPTHTHNPTSAVTTLPPGDKPHHSGGIPGQGQGAGRHLYLALETPPR